MRNMPKRSPHFRADRDLAVRGSRKLGRAMGERTPTSTLRKTGTSSDKKSRNFKRVESLVAEGHFLFTVFSWQQKPRQFPGGVR